MPSLDRAKKRGRPRPEPPERSTRRPFGAHVSVYIIFTVPYDCFVVP